MEETIRELADSIYREKVLRARKAPLTQKMGWGAELYHGALSRMRDGVRHQFPTANKAEVEEILQQRLDRLTKVEEHGVFRPAEREAEVTTR